MRTFFQALVPALWLVWLAYWVIAARGAKETVREESAASRASHYVPLIIGGLLIGMPHILGPALEQRFHAHTFRWYLVGLALVAIGLGFAALARAWLGRNWSAAVTVKDRHELVRGGPYALVRHPIYAGMLLALFGTVLTVDRWRALIGFALTTAGLVRKLVVEERFMAAEFGEAHARYRAEVKALVPFVA